MPTARERQVKQATREREGQIAETVKEELQRLTTFGGGVRYRFWRGRAKGDPGFVYTTEKVECFGKSGWVSWVEQADTTQMDGTYTPITESFELHKTRNAAKARAWNLWQGWRFSEFGAEQRWGTFV